MRAVIEDLTDMARGLVLLLTLSLCISLSVCNAVYEESDIEDEYIIVFKKLQEAVRDLPIVDILRNITGCELMQEFKFKARSYARLKFNDSNPIILNLLKNNPFVELVEKNKKIKFVHPEQFQPTNLTDDQPSDGDRKRRSSSVCDGRVLGDNGWGPTRIAYRNTPNYRRDPYTYSNYDNGQGVRVYVVDSGIKVNHVDFGGRAVHGMTGSQIRGEGDDDLNGHGTHCAGIAAGSEYGVAPMATPVSVKVIGEDGFATTADIIEGLTWIAADVAAMESRQGKRTRTVVNMSLGGPGAVRSMELAVSSAIEDGIPIVIAAGNSFEDACGFSPARVNEAITVGATDSSDRLASFSNWGACVDILAPGVDIAAPYPDSRRLLNRNNIYQLLSGTSQACPHVAGAIARYLSSLNDDVFQEATPHKVMNLALETATNNRINIPRSASRTPNKLLYKECVEDRVDYNIFEQGAGGGPDSAGVITASMSLPTLTLITLISILHL